jgi:endonuclease/exonuclease/phosphatase family metal-dependent hydrolase
MRTVLSIANFNMHCGMDGWGRPFDYVGAIRSLDTDVIVLEESWTVAGEPRGQAEVAAQQLGYDVVTHPLGEGRRIRPQVPHKAASWIAQPSWSDSNRALYMDGVRPLPAKVQALERWQSAEMGSWGIAVLTRPGLGVESHRVLPLTQLRADGVRRAALVVDLTVDGHPLSVVGTHMPHLPYGSHRTWAELRRLLRSSVRPDAVLSGDMNTWGPLVVAFMPGWRRAVRGRTWPSWKPHSQIDHIVVHGALRVLWGEVLPDAGSDHRPIRTTLEVR